MEGLEGRHGDVQKDGTIPNLDVLWEMRMLTYKIISILAFSSEVDVKELDSIMKVYDDDSKLVVNRSFSLIPYWK